MKKLSLILAVILAMCACAFAETAQETIALTEADLMGVWNMEYTTADGYMVTADAYGITVLLTLAEDGSAALDYNGEPGGEMSWYIQDGHAYISGYNPEADVEILLNEYGVLEITDAIGSMFFTRPEAEAE